MATIMRKMNIISRCEALFRTEQSGGELAGIYHSYVLAICRRPGMPQEALARHLCLNKSNVTRHLARLESEGYIRRENGTDKREQLVYPTEKMLAIHPEVMRITKDWNTRLAEEVSKEELAVFLAVLDKMLVRSRAIVYGEEVTE